jgi:hypothetical protein
VLHEEEPMDVRSVENLPPEIVLRLLKATLTHLQRRDPYLARLVLNAAGAVSRGLADLDAPIRFGEPWAHSSGT